MSTMFPTRGVFLSTEHTPFFNFGADVDHFLKANSKNIVLYYPLKLRNRKQPPLNLTLKNPLAISRNEGKISYSLIEITVIHGASCKYKSKGGFLS